MRGKEENGTSVPDEQHKVQKKGKKAKQRAEKEDPEDLKQGDLVGDNDNVPTPEPGHSAGTQSKASKGFSLFKSKGKKTAESDNISTASTPAVSERPGFDGETRSITESTSNRPANEELPIPGTEDNKLPQPDSSNRDILRPDEREVKSVHDERPIRTIEMPQDNRPSNEDGPTKPEIGDTPIQPANQKDLTNTVGIKSVEQPIVTEQGQMSPKPSKSKGGRSGARSGRGKAPFSGDRSGNSRTPLSDAGAFPDEVELPASSKMTDIPGETGMPKELTQVDDNTKQLPTPAASNTKENAATLKDPQTTDAAQIPQSRQTKPNSKKAKQAPQVTARAPGLSTQSPPRTPQRTPPSRSTRNRPRGSAQRRVTFRKSTIPILRARAQKKSAGRTMETLLRTLQTLAAEVEAAKLCSTQPRRRGSEAIVADPSIPQDEKIQILSLKLNDEEEEIRKLRGEKTELHRQVTSLKKRVAREVERAKPLPKITSTVPTSVEANLNLRYQFTKTLKIERDKYQKLQEENRVLAARIKEYESKPHRKESPSGSTYQRTNDMLFLRKKLKEADAEKRKMEDTISSMLKQLERESKAKQKMDRDAEAMRQQFTHLRNQFGGLAGEEDEGSPVRGRERRSFKSAARRVLRMNQGSKRTGIASNSPGRGPESPIRSHADPSPSRNHDVKGSEAKSAKSPLVAEAKRKPVTASKSKQATEQKPEHTENYARTTVAARSKAKDVTPTAEKRTSKTADRPPESNSEAADTSRSKLPAVFRKPRGAPDRQRSVLANLDRDLREAGSLIDSLDRDLRAAGVEHGRDPSRKRGVQRQGTVQPEKELNHVGQDGSTPTPSNVGAESNPPLPDKSGSEMEDISDARLRSARIRVEYDVWVKKKNEENAAAAAAAAMSVANTQ
ncbi:uncharacterized protein SPPG_07012 [Spizellomyces punctatus DAOM BR117]|uniref:Lebercilin domain-containing protein n=1 Tax=Spizellomyces punctatus (strain DAOM BR117) TaxID=645134 RepID=A0A0L0H8K6_SPIPD|nr:uncharacterized protein SPPG_07012 [Spizellomyces punctatus DAOM BR117]KNC97537.1 hypothetical protein SPPG_07012 [Spizellomyces punctatus DAOM BR117]|eukprot:XP_016605577.1 hypothetical protein SPPG_07012 [Spizellomyces punctatus DAOM BR117]